MAMSSASPSRPRAPGHYRLRWTPAQQMFACGTAQYVSHGPTEIEPSHDLAHLLVAACSDLDWLPVGSDAEIRPSEYNAVLLENVLDRSYDAVFKPELEAEIVGRTAGNARFFVEEYYAPFPIPAGEAYRRFCAGIDLAALMRLSPYFFRQKTREIACPSQALHRFSFAKDDAPPAAGEAALFRHIVENQFGRMRREAGLS